MTSQPTPAIPAVGTKIEFLMGSREGCRATVTKRVGRHQYFIVTMDYCPRATDYGKGDDIQCSAADSARAAYKVIA